jgi:hypothetical protein
MGTKKYSSYAQIDRELEILKIEKEISYQKLVFGIQQTKDNLAPKNIVKSLMGSYMPNIPGPYGKIISLAFPFVSKWILKKRG